MSNPVNFRGARTTIQSVDRAVRILTALSDAPSSLGVTELAVELVLAKGTVHGLLRTLQQHGLVEQDADTEKYRLGPTLVALSNSYLEVNELRTHVLAWSELLATTTSEAVHVVAPHFRKNGVLVVHHVFRPDSSLQILEVGSILPLHATALGKAVLAFQPDDVRTSLVGQSWPRLTGRTLVGRATLDRELEGVRHRYYAREREESIVGEGGLAAPIFRRGGSVAGAVGVTGAPDRILAGGRERSLARSVIEAARGISRDLGALRWPPGQ